MKEQNKRGEQTIALALLGIVLFSKPVLSGFGIAREGFLFGIPSLYLYLFVAWAVLIVLLALVVESADDPAASPTDRRPLPDEDPSGTD